ncbi:MAG: hypothetical protein EWM72_00664 [Nitrospira sp.]|nr:MAG: hypothetical protein EWM72_00664 [Nitrospira sp.]
MKLEAVLVIAMLLAASVSLAQVESALIASEIPGKRCGQKTKLGAFSTT